ncbi:speckle-type POZ protein-like isoform X1 [Denticeps clupeoides]|uniref:speckle-type POZ protein-like isoform X1 n=1 Tax=Denticeps clupeoides TaxID=299321 RepID=UPI0010A49005|nr:speckle-type POZ protein-like isoform X1 [Denticeps clupeoides]
MEEDSRLLRNNSLVLLFEMMVTLESENIMRQKVQVPQCRLAADFGELLQEPLLSDCSLWVDGQEIQAHKAILAGNMLTCGQI